MDEKLDVFYAAFPNRLKNGFVGKLIGKDRTDDLFIKLQDKMLPVAQMIDDIKKRGGKITVAMDAYLKQDLMSGKIAVGIEERTNRLYKPMLQKIKDLGLSYKDVETYLHARHARERNARMAQINPTLTGPGSGMSDRAAAGHMKLKVRSGSFSRLPSCLTPSLKTPAALAWVLVSPWTLSQRPTRRVTLTPTISTTPRCAVMVMRTSSVMRALRTSERR
jgi:hypothetical protein